MNLRFTLIFQILLCFTDGKSSERTTGVFHLHGNHRGDHLASYSLWELCQPIALMCDFSDSGFWLRVRDGDNKGAGMERPVKCLSKAGKTKHMGQVHD